jgi:GMP synthase (glutamine-hydrolysing)
MGRVLILKMGSTLPALKARKGDFEDWIIGGMGLTPDRVSVVDVSIGQPLPPLDGFAGVVVTGSHTMVTEQKEWSEQAAAWLAEAVREERPVLGICYGHQLPAHALGGEVGNNPNGREFGTIEVTLEESAKDDPLMGDLPTRIRVHVGHTQSVLRLPPGAVRLASNHWDANQAVRFGASAWGVQFHPEFDAAIIQEYITQYREMLAAEGQDPDRLLTRASDTEFGPLLLGRFSGMVRQGARS